MSEQTPARRALGRNVITLSAVSLLTDVSSEMIYPLVPAFLSTVLGANASAVGVVEGAAESTAALLKLVSGWLSDRTRRRKPLTSFSSAAVDSAAPSTTPTALAFAPSTVLKNAGTSG